MIITKRIEKLNNLGESDIINCWGTTMFSLGSINKMRWIDSKTMNKFLNLKTARCNENHQIGDIVVFLNNKNELVHTAIYYGNNLWFHKLGSLPTKVEPLAKIESFYNGICEKLYGTSLKKSFRRIKI